MKVEPRTMLHYNSAETLPDTATKLNVSSSSPSILIYDETWAKLERLQSLGRDASAEKFMTAPREYKLT